jgi:hypothetical protein
MRPIYIYSLSDPRDESVMYVGKTYHQKKRAYQHFSSCVKCKTPKDRWIFELKQCGLKPVFKILEITDEHHWKWCEKKHISFFKAAGFPLTNSNSGGTGCCGRKFSEEHKKKISMALKGRKCPENVKMAVSKANKGRKWTDETRSKLMPKRFGRILSEETKEKIRVKATGRIRSKLSEEVKARMSAIHKERHRIKALTFN